MSIPVIKMITEQWLMPGSVSAGAKGEAVGLNPGATAAAVIFHKTVRAKHQSPEPNFRTGCYRFKIFTWGGGGRWETLWMLPGNTIKQPWTTST